MKKAYVRPEVEYINFYSEEFITAEGLAERVAREFAKTTDFLAIINRAMKFAFEER